MAAQPDPHAELAAPRPHLFANLVEGAIALALTYGLLVFLTLPWSGGFGGQWEALFGEELWGSHATLVAAALAAGLVTGLALGVAGTLVASGRERASYWALCAAPMAMGAGAFAAELVDQGSPLQAGLHVDDALVSPYLWGASARWILIAVAIYGPLVHARARGASRRQQAVAMALGGLAAILAQLPDPTPDRADRWFPQLELIPSGDFNVLLLVVLAPALIVPFALPLGARAARVLLSVLGQPLPAPPPSDLPHVREWPRRLWRLLRDVRSGPLLRERLAALESEHADLLRVLTVFLAWSAFSSGLLWITSAEPAKFLTYVAQAVGCAGVLSLALRFPFRWRVRPGLAAALVAHVLLIGLSNGAMGLAAALSAALLALVCGRILPLVAVAFVVAANPAVSQIWPYLPVGGWRRPFLGSTVLSIDGGSLVALLVLYVICKGWRWVPTLLVSCACGVSAALATHRWTQALYETDLVMWLFAREFSLIFGVSAAALGGWAARKAPRWGALALVIAALLAGTTHHLLRGDLIDGYAIRRLRHAAQDGDAEAMLELAAHLETGADTMFGAQRTEQAHIWYRRAAEAGNAEAMYRYALRLHDGRVPRDRRAARRWMQAAAEEDHVLAKAWLARH